MKVVGPNGVSTPASTRPTRSASGFSLGQAAAPSAPAAAETGLAGAGTSTDAANAAAAGEGPAEGEGRPRRFNRDGKPGGEGRPQGQRPEGGGAERAKWQSMNALLGLAEEAPAGTTLPEFVRELQRRQQQQHAPTRSAVTLSTLHAAKGLEWDCVYIVGLSEGFVPITFAHGLEAIDEERRLFYVGITRARKVLELSWAVRGTAARADRAPSRFLDEVRAPKER